MENMNNLWIFGDSFSSDFSLNTIHENVKQYLNFINEKSINHWPTLLANKLNYNLINLAKGGNSNYQIFQDFCDKCQIIKENDIVIIGWGLIEKFRISHENTFINITSSNNSIGMISKDTIDEILNNRKKIHKTKDGKIIDRWAWEVYLWEDAITVLSKSKKFKTFFWSTEEPRLIYNESEECKSKKNYLCKGSTKPLIHYLRENGCLSVSDETNKLIGDDHFGQIGHQKQSEIFYKEIIK